MSRRFAVNSSPLILLGRISRLDLFPALAEQVVVPQAVLQELIVKQGQDWLAQTVSSHPGIDIVDDGPLVRCGPVRIAPERAVGTRTWEGFLADHLSQPA